MVSDTLGTTNVHREMSKPVSFKELVLRDLGFNDISDIHTVSDEMFSKYLAVKLEIERKEVERLRESNMNRLSVFMENCSQNKAMPEDIIRKILNITDISSYGNIEQPTISRKRSLEGHLSMNPKGHRRFNSELPTVSNNRTSPLHQQRNLPHDMPYQQNLPLAPIINPHYNEGPISSYSFPSGAAENGNRPKNTSVTSQNANYDVQGNLSVPSGVHQYSNSGYRQATEYFPSKSGPPVMVVYPDSQQNQLHAVQYAPPTNPNIVQERQFQINQENKPPIGKFGHGRSQSAQIFPQSSSKRPKSPSKGLQATPQKQMNFLIHTPKHPPPT